jgi:general secretion pathway protein E
MTRVAGGEPSESFADFLQLRGVALSDRRAVRREFGEEVGELQSAWRANRASGVDLAALACEYYELPRADYEALSDVRLHHDGLSIQFLRESFVLPFYEGDVLWLAVADPSTGDAIGAVKLALGAVPRLCVLAFEELDLLYERIARESHEADALRDATELEAEFFDTDSIEALQDLARGAPIVRAIDQILERAFECGATDIHFETGRENLRVRFRVDGLLRLDHTMPRHLAPAVISRVKILAGLDIAERRLPQDGRATVKIRNTEADLRVALAPTMYGETAVARILLKDVKLLEFGRIGMTASHRDSIEALLREPHGILIVTGPTGSGKTTTLATAIGMLNNPVRKIVTVEDPIEYQIPGVHQTQIKPSIGLTFATALRSFLRHDPDVIMVGEMRDTETAQIGIQAALTGHLVLTTLHTNSACDAVVRLADMGVEPFLIAASLRGVLGQRLVRRLCERCREPDPKSADLVNGLSRKHGFFAPRERGFAKSVGCPACGNTGFRGRVGVFEVLRVDDAIRTLIGTKADSQRILTAARETGLTTMLEDGFDKAARGITTVDEVLRTVG